MLKHKIGLVVAILLLAATASADSFKVEWNLSGAENVKLDQFSHSFKAAGMTCEVGRAVKVYSSQDGTGLVESRSVTCKKGKQITVKEEIRCDRKQVSNFLDAGSFKVECNTK
jgi:hypothetical protein